MTQTELRQLDALLEIAEENNTPLTAWEVEFLHSLDGRRERELSEKQADVFDRLVAKHLKGD